MKINLVDCSMNKNYYDMTTITNKFLWNIRIT